MISFKVFSRGNISEVINSLSESLSVEALKTLSEIVVGFDTDNEDLEFALSVYSGCALVRVFDMGKYFFLFPYEIETNANLSSSLSAIAEYAMREEISLTFSDVPYDCLSYFQGFRHMDIDAEDALSETYRIRIKNECELTAEIPTVARGRVELNAILEEDISDYARLCKDKNVNKYWGYDYSEDVLQPSDRYFYENATLEFQSGISVCMAVRFQEKFVGESVIYAFDGRGSAEFAIRLLPEWQGCGLGTQAVLATIDAAREMGLVTLRSKIMNDNISSLAMLRKVTGDFVKEESCTTFFIKL